MMTIQLYVTAQFRRNSKFWRSFDFFEWIKVAPEPENVGRWFTRSMKFKFRLTVVKDGPNKGRPFYGCSKPRDSSCGFFMWADNASEGTSSVFSRGHDGPRKTNTFDRVSSQNTG